MLQEQAAEFGGTLSWEADEFAGRGRQIRPSRSRCVAEIRFPAEAIYGAAQMIEMIASARNGLRIDSIFCEPSTILYRSRALGRPECIAASSPPRCRPRITRTRAQDMESEDGPLIAAIARYLD
jgi:hypothetical protein